MIIEDCLTSGTQRMTGWPLTQLHRRPACDLGGLTVPRPYWQEAVTLCPRGAKIKNSYYEAFRFEERRPTIAENGQEQRTRPTKMAVWLLPASLRWLLLLNMRFSEDSHARDLLKYERGCLLVSSLRRFCLRVIRVQGSFIVNTTCDIYWNH